MKIALFTATQLRHRFCSSHFVSKFGDKLITFFEETPKASIKNDQDYSLRNKHLFRREEAEINILRSHSEFKAKSHNTYRVPCGWFSTESCLDALKKYDVDLIAVYGTSLIKGKIVDLYSGRMINMHLGISPYYRGSGTNFFAFVNQQPEYHGTTFMYLDTGIDTGQIIHQIRPTFSTGDSFYDISAKSLLRSFTTFSKLIDNFSSLKSPVKTSGVVNKTRVVCYKKDFTEMSVIRLADNMHNGIVDDYLENKHMLDYNAPILQQTDLV